MRPIGNEKKNLPGRVRRKQIHIFWPEYQGKMILHKSICQFFQFFVEVQPILGVKNRKIRQKNVFLHLKFAKTRQKKSKNQILDGQNCGEPSAGTQVLALEIKLDFGGICCIQIRGIRREGAKFLASYLNNCFELRET